MIEAGILEKCKAIYESFTYEKGNTDEKRITVTADRPGPTGLW